MAAGAAAGPDAAARPPERPAAVLLPVLEELVGFAPSEVLLRRLDRARRLAAEVDPRHPSLEDPAWAALLDALTVQETRLFRTASQLLTFRDDCLPALFAAAGDRPLRLLSAGCATGEEAWSLALIAVTAAESRGAPPPEVLGVDLCRSALAVAVEGRYPAGPPDALREVPPPYHAMFLREGEVVMPPAALRPHLRFRRCNLLELPEDGARYDAICCRNVLIYLTGPARAAVLRHLAQRLVPGGALLLGATDTPPAALGLAGWGGAGGGAIWRAPA
jgi:chemotaxis protein methyltransferase CheR